MLLLLLRLLLRHQHPCCGYYYQFNDNNGYQHSDLSLPTGLNQALSPPVFPSTRLLMVGL